MNPTFISSTTVGTTEKPDGDALTNALSCKFSTEKKKNKNYPKITHGYVMDAPHYFG
ncbi:29979_t:CDS:2 [Gigaspora margarita]|uniref:29979_t:CDS:1 n=1 Tax=Gigaspora margarita TaxID=4874 RepID=A0ABN7UJZ0_GIGMA|nr:29979_t:CDS:2 [Gigaspora margarita]